MILVIGSTGMVGSEVCRLLISKNYAVRAMVRSNSDSSKLNNLKELGVQILNGNLCDKSTFPKILEGISTVITTVSSMPFSYLPGENDIRQVDDEGMINLIDAAKRAGVKQFIYMSFSKNIDLDFPLRNAKRKVEKYLQNSGMSYTILRPSYFMEAWLSPAVSFDPLNGKVNVFGSGDRQIAYISFKDVAKFAVECISNTNGVNTIIELGGPENLSQRGAVRIFEDELQNKINVHIIPLDSLMAQFNGVEDDMQKSFTGLMICMANGDFIDMKNVLRKFPVKLTSVNEYARSIAQLELSK
jgi:NADH dehydrogenase